MVDESWLSHGVALPCVTNFEAHFLLGRNRHHLGVQYVSNSESAPSFGGSNRSSGRDGCEADVQAAEDTKAFRCASTICSLTTQLEQRNGCSDLHTSLAFWSADIRQARRYRQTAIFRGSTSWSACRSRYLRNDRSLDVGSRLTYPKTSKGSSQCWLSGSRCRYR